MNIDQTQTIIFNSLANYYEIVPHVVGFAVPTTDATMVNFIATDGATTIGTDWGAGDDHSVYIELTGDEPFCCDSGCEHCE